ncbi:MAG: 16S rRNA processing protein RimM [Acidobacteria bacterium]|nr:16S rRNA processing protein RimM [Acidobacteriota bacterium]
MEPGTGPGFSAVARIARIRGNRGEVLAEPYSDFPERYRNLRNVWLEFADQHREHALVEAVWEHKGRQVLKFAGIDSISQASRLVGAWVLVEPDETVSLAVGSFFDHDLVGCRVIDGRGTELGVVSGIHKIPGNDLLVVNGAHGEILIPAVGVLCREISLPRKQIIVDLPEGLIELNR